MNSSFTSSLWARPWNPACVDEILKHFHKNPENLVSYVENGVERRRKILGVHLFQLSTRLGVELSERSEEALKQGLMFVDPSAFPETRLLLLKGRLSFPKPEKFYSRRGPLPSKHSSVRLTYSL
jgi:hypothetical protein